jgi:hypothetical protein
MLFWRKKKPVFYPIKVAMCAEVRDWVFENCKSPIQINTNGAADGEEFTIFFSDEIESTWIKLLFAGKTAAEIAEQTIDPMGERRRALIAGSLHKKRK